MQFVQAIGGADLECFGDFDKFDDAQTPLSALIFGDEATASGWCTWTSRHRNARRKLSAQWFKEAARRNAMV
jgi:hypothetical protein